MLLSSLHGPLRTCCMRFHLLRTGKCLRHSQCTCQLRLWAHKCLVRISHTRQLRPVTTCQLGKTSMKVLHPLNTCLLGIMCTFTIRRLQMYQLNTYRKSLRPHLKLNQLRMASTCLSLPLARSCLLCSQCNVISLHQPRTCQLGIPSSPLLLSGR